MKHTIFRLGLLLMAPLISAQILQASDERPHQQIEKILTQESVSAENLAHLYQKGQIHPFVFEVFNGKYFRPENDWKGQGLSEPLPIKIENIRSVKLLAAAIEALQASEEPFELKLYFDKKIDVDSVNAALDQFFKDMERFPRVKKNLVNLSLSGKMSCLPAALGSLNNLKTLEVWNDDLELSLPDEILTLSQLQSIKLHCKVNNLPDLGLLPNLTEVSLNLLGSFYVRNSNIEVLPAQLFAKIESQQITLRDSFWQGSQEKEAFLRKEIEEIIAKSRNAHTLPTISDEIERLERMADHYKTLRNNRPWWSYPLAATIAKFAVPAASAVATSALMQFLNKRPASRILSPKQTRGYAALVQTVAASVTAAGTYSLTRYNLDSAQQEKIEVPLCTFSPFPGKILTQTIDDNSRIQLTAAEVYSEEHLSTLASGLKQHASEITSVIENFRRTLTLPMTRQHSDALDALSTRMINIERHLGSLK